VFVKTFGEIFLKKPGDFLIYPPSRSAKRPSLHKNSFLDEYFFFPASARIQKMQAFALTNAMICGTIIGLW
jgi:hypothetical protein